jgi:hypothetical protein
MVLLFWWYYFFCFLPLSGYEAGMNASETSRSPKTEAMAPPKSQTAEHSPENTDWHLHRSGLEKLPLSAPNLRYIDLLPFRYSFFEQPGSIQGIARIVSASPGKQIAFDSLRTSSLRLRIPVTSLRGGSLKPDGDAAFLRFREVGNEPYPVFGMPKLNRLSKACKKIQLVNRATFKASQGTLVKRLIPSRGNGLAGCDTLST